MRGLKFAIAVAVTSVVLVAAIGVAGVLTVRSALANGPWMAGPWFAAQGYGGQGFQLPPELQGLANLPADQRYAHFTGVQVSLKDASNNPLTVNVTPGKVTSVDANNLTIAANDGTSKSFAMTANTIVHGKTAQGGTQATQPGLAQDDQVVVVTFNNDATAIAVVAPGGPSGFGPGNFGPSGFGGWRH